MIDQGPFLGLTSNFSRQPERTYNAKDSQCKRAEENRKEGGNKQNWERFMAKKKNWAYVHARNWNFVQFCA